MIRACKSCLWEDKGQCRRMPPVMVLWPSNNQHPIVYFPTQTWSIVAPDDWCGEYKEEELSK